MIYIGAGPYMGWAGGLSRTSPVFHRKESFIRIHGSGVRGGGGYYVGKIIVSTKLTLCAWLASGAGS